MAAYETQELQIQVRCALASVQYKVARKEVLRARDIRRMRHESKTPEIWRAIAKKKVKEALAYRRLKEMTAEELRNFRDFEDTEPYVREPEHWSIIRLHRSVEPSRLVPPLLYAAVVVLSIMFAALNTLLMR